MIASQQRQLSRMNGYLFITPVLSTPAPPLPPLPTLFDPAFEVFGEKIIINFRSPASPFPRFFDPDFEIFGKRPILLEEVVIVVAIAVALAVPVVMCYLRGS
ncbi:unnamed protein product [Onchocerca flexuosa]|uniref:Uncharacterized protein n=1 Tax=Onchocerca flexuosa TaxID=387005 RepID=A0A183HJR5_9BILA|nr:unnamed protein product [Onchocerca flexuosa]